MLRLRCLLPLLCLLLVAGPAPAQEPVQARDQQTAPAAASTTEQMVDLGGFKLHTMVLGAGSPAVVFDTGMGDTLDTWQGLAPAIAETTRVVLYTRAGLGRSEPGPLPRSSSRLAAELYTLLGALDIPPPYLLVGHSLGGINIRFFADRYPDEVAGLVFIDATTEQMRPRLETPEDHQQWQAQLAQLPPGPQAEQQSLPDDVATLATLGPPPACPAVVLTAMARPVLSERMIAMGMTEQRVEELQQRAWGFHEALAARFSPGRHVAARHSHHFIHHDEPDLVRDEILQLLQLVRQTGQPTPPQPGPDRNDR